MAIINAFTMSYTMPSTMPYIMPYSMRMKQIWSHLVGRQEHDAGVDGCVANFQQLLFSRQGGSSSTTGHAAPAIGVSVAFPPESGSS